MNSLHKMRREINISYHIMQTSECRRSHFKQFNQFAICFMSHFKHVNMNSFTVFFMERFVNIFHTPWHWIFQNGVVFEIQLSFFFLSSFQPLIKSTTVNQPPCCPLNPHPLILQILGLKVPMKRMRRLTGNEIVVLSGLFRLAFFGFFIFVFGSSRFQLAGKVSPFFFIFLKWENAERAESRERNRSL